MEVPRFWRNKSFMLNPNQNGYRPESPNRVLNQEVQKTSQNTSAEISINIERRATVYQSPNK